MDKQRATRHSCNYNRVKTSTTEDTDIIQQYERATFRAGVLLGVSFGLMFAIGLWLGW